MEIIGRYIIFTADDEMPDCLMCDRCDHSDNGKYCGPEYGWARYERTERIEINDLQGILPNIKLHRCN
jgi:hypothetical protein